ncbi:MAG: hypothetical protein NTY53_20600, partial [Kiritimatiellaeota bacterium]|nr:hypothetical protein [Kiritimatiellota bacterium]
ANWSLTVADNVYVWNNYAQKYEQAFLNDDTWGLTDANWKWCYMGADNNPHPCAQTNIFNVTPSTGFYIVNRHGPVNLYLTGEVPTGTNTVGLAGLHMIAYPFPVSQPLATLLSTNDGAKANWSLTVADNIYLWNATSRKYDLFFYNDDTWGLTDANWKWCYMGTDNNPHAATNTIQPGMGFFYKVNGTNFNWNVACPYSF